MSVFLIHFPINTTIDKTISLNEKVLLKSVMNGGTLRVNLNQEDQ